MRWKTMFITIVINIFVMLASSILFEYINLSERFISIEDSIQEALDSSIVASVSSEEMFSAQYQAEMSSFAGTAAKETTEARTLIWIDDSAQATNDDGTPKVDADGNPVMINTGCFYKVNTYNLAKFYEENGRLPQTRSDLDTLNDYFSSSSLTGTTSLIFEWLYGALGTDYTNSALSWANRNRARISEYTGTSIGSRSASSVNSNFKEYYEKIGKYQQTAGLLKEKSGTNSFSLNMHTYPTLMNMGFSFMGGYTDNGSSVTHDNFTSTFHVGKGINSQRKTYYYLTPASLGVTYVPVEVLKPTFVANLDTIVRLNHVGGASTSGFNSDNVAEAGYCISPNVYKNNGTEQAKHTKSSTDEDIVTDGLVEFDLNSTKIKVDYFYVDFNSSTTPESNRQKIISKINGAVQSYNGSGVAEKNPSQAREGTLNAFISSSNDTVTQVENFGSSDLKAEFETVRHGRIIARISVRVKVHVPYQSSIMQWMCERFGTNNHHYDIKMWDSSSGKAVVDSDGIWYQYTTYYCTSRS